ncbi:MAG: hypothetical protein LPJ89_01200 [Hymenobacteraceae bacterium]|nr:hypothetical protein [Hymenobacteraceae bacterium]MDX5396647.1 hypothetical protein [Hymenobacteraceae bacterium]MDX5442379.1 hypothetical protein [Hymenobacteraceae bacterium]MDX5512714.1 hypothetical protein [Hymenobacteraceae bacterium]
MSATSFKQLLQIALQKQEPKVYDVPAEELYKKFEQEEAQFRKQKAAEAPPALAFDFERIRLGIAYALVSLFSQLSEHEESAQLVALLKRALKANSIQEIDEIIHKDAELFENLFLEFFEDEQREQILQLLEETLQASTKTELDHVIHDTLDLFDQQAQE